MATGNTNHKKEGKEMNDVIVSRSALTSETINTYSARFISYLDVAPKSITTYRKALNQFVKYLNDKGITEPTREDVIDFRNLIKEDHKNTTVQCYLTAIKLFFKWCDSENLYPNIAEHVKGAKVSREQKKDSLTPAQVQDLLQSIDRTTYEGIRDYALLTLMVTCGLRTIEVNRALVEDIKTIGTQTVLFVQGKGKEDKANYVKLSAHTERALREYLTIRRNYKGTEPLFTSTSNNSKGKSLSTKTISDIAKRHFIEIGLNSERITAHSLRHTAVTLSLLQGESLQEVKEFARHENIATTLIYAHNLEKINNNCSSAIETLIFS